MAANPLAARNPPNGSYSFDRDLLPLQSIRNRALVASNGKEPEAALQQVKAVIGKWRERKPFEFESTPSAIIEQPALESQQASPSSGQN